MFFSPFFSGFIISFAVSSIAALFFRKYWDRNQTIKRLGGIALIVGFIAALSIDQNLIFSSSLWGIIGALVVVLFFGIAEDFFHFSWKIQLLFQVALSILVYFLGIKAQYLTNPFGGIFILEQDGFSLLSLTFGIIWFLVIMNAINWLDGLDGLSGGVSLISAITIFSISLLPEVNQPPMAIIAMAFAGASLGFLTLNFSPSRIIAGTSGSFFFGFILAALAIFSGTKIATALLVLSLPLIDFVWVILERLTRKQSIFKGDYCHLHYRLKEIGLSDRKIILGYYSITISLSLIALYTRSIGKLASLIIIAILLVLMIGLIRKKANKLCGIKNHAV